MEKTPVWTPALAEDVAARLAHADGWMLDVDGCLVRTSKAGGVGGELIDGAARLLDWLRRHGRKFVICTNASQSPVSRYAAHLRELGLDVADDEVMTAGSAAADYIALQHPRAKVLVVGDTGLTEALTAHGVQLAAPNATDADVVVVGAADTYASATLNGACLSIADKGAPFYSSVETLWFHGGVKRSIAASSVIAAAITAVTGVKPQVCGKPSQAIGEVLRRRLGGPGKQLVIVGDMASIEVVLAHRMNALGALVLSGGTASADLPYLPEEQRPHWFGRDVGELIETITAVHA
jgi:HAD superfamily hydrolase (TIGR01450 family)